MARLARRADRIRDRLNALIEAGKRVLATSHSPGEFIISDNYVDSEMFYEWKAGALSLVSYVFGERSTHHRLLLEGCQHSRHEDTVRGLGVLNAANQDIDHGFLAQLNDLVAADLFADFLEMADHLVNSGYKDPAAVLIGGVLEEHLRRLCSGNSMGVSEEVSRSARIGSTQISQRHPSTTCWTKRP